MAVTVIHTPEIDESKFSLSVEHGGTGARSPKKAAENLGLVAYSQVDQKNGVGLLSPENTVQRKNYPSSLVDTTLPVFFGDAVFYAGDSLVIQIANYDSSAVYSVDVSSMGNANYVINGDQITLSSKNGVPGAQVLKINGREFHFLIEVRKPNQPSLTNLSGSLVQGHVALSAEVPFEGQNFVSSAFSDVTGTLVHNYTNWELSTSLDFSTVAMSSNLQADKGSWSTPAFNPDSDYFLRFRHVATNGGVSDWSMVYSFRTAKLRTIGKPNIISPTQNAVGVAAQLTLNASAFSSVNFTGHHVSTDWQIATDVDFTNVVQSSMNDAVNLTSWQSAALTYGAVYYTRVRYRADIAASNGSPYSDWSSTTMFTVTADDRAIQKPVLTFPDGVQNVSALKPNVTGSAFTPLNYLGNEVHIATDWQIATDAGFTNLIFDVLGDGVNKTSKTDTWSLFGDTIYFIRARYRGNLKISDWSETVMFHTQLVSEVTIYIGAGNAGESYRGSPLNAVFKVSGTDISYKLYGSSDFTPWTGTTSPMAGYTYGTLWRNEGESFHIASLFADATHVWGTVDIYDAAWGWRWTGIPFTANLDLRYVNFPFISTLEDSNNLPVTGFTLRSTAFGSTFNETHVSTDWQIATDLNFTNLVLDRNDTVNKTSYVVPVTLAYSTAYYGRCRHRGATKVSPWSYDVRIMTTVDNRTIAAPTITQLTQPPTIASDVPVVLSFGGSPFSANYQDTLQSSEWEFASLNGAWVNNTVVSGSVINAGMQDKLAMGALNRIRVRYHGVHKVSDWSPAFSIYMGDGYVGS